MKVLKSSENGIRQDRLVTIMLDHQWLGPSKPRLCLCGGWKAPMGAKNQLEQHVEHVASIIFERAG